MSHYIASSRLFTPFPPRFSGSAGNQGQTTILLKVVYTDYLDIGCHKCHVERVYDMQGLRYM